MSLRILLAILCMSPLAQAYTPPASFVFTNAMKDRKGLSSVEWSAKVTDQKTLTTFKENLRIDFSAGKLSIQFLSPNDEVLGALQAPLSGLPNLGKFWLHVGLDPNFMRVKSALLELGLFPKPSTEVRLTRQGSQVAWTWGEKGSIHFLKDEFYPIGFQSDAGPLGDRVLFDSFAATGAQVHVPKVARIFIQGKESFRFELRSVKIDSGSKLNITPAPITSLSVREWVSLVR